MITITINNKNHWQEESDDSFIHSPRKHCLNFRPTQELADRTLCVFSVHKH